MLDRLREIDWRNLTHAYGSAEDVPNLLRKLASPYENDRKQAIHEFFGNIWHQGTVYEATSHVVPFLLELVEHDDVQQKHEILYLLEAIGTGSSYLDVHENLDWYRSSRQTPEHIASKQQELVDVRRAHDEVVAGVPILLSIFTLSVDANLRVAAAFTLSVCQERTDEIVAVVGDVFSADDDPYVKSAALFCLRRLMMRCSREGRESELTDEHVVALCRELLQRPGEPALVRLSAAVSLLRIDARVHHEAALPVARETMEEAAEPFAASPFIQGDSPWLSVSEALSNEPELAATWLIELSRHESAHIRKEAVWGMSMLCQRWRSGPAMVVPRLIEMLADTDGEVCEEVVRAVGDMGRVGETALLALADAPKGVRRLGKRGIQLCRDARCGQDVKQWLSSARSGLTLSQMVEKLRDETLHDYDLADLVANLGALGADARPAVDEIMALLEHDSQWVRIRAARALWDITADLELVMPTLIEELRCRPVGLLAADQIKKIGPRAIAAEPRLREIVQSPTRVVECGSIPGWIAEDEAFQDACRSALDAVLKQDAQKP